jgi:hypothetical protein
VVPRGPEGHLSHLKHDQVVQTASRAKRNLVIIPSLGTFTLGFENPLPLMNVIKYDVLGY